MSASTFMARRYMQAGRTNRFVSWISVLTISGVAIGVASMIVVWSILNGFETELRHRFLAANANIMIYKFPTGVDQAKVSELSARIAKDYPKAVTGVAPFVYYETMARNKSILHGALVHGIDPRQHENVQSISSLVKPEGALKYLQQEVDRPAGAALPVPPAAIIGSGLLSLLDAKVGDTIELLRPDADSLGGIQTFRVAGTYDSGLRTYDNKLVLMSVPTAQAFFGMGPRVTGLELGLADPWGSTAIAAEMEDKYDGYSVRDWLSLNRPLFEAIKVERAVILLITALVACVAGFNILTTIFVAVSQRQRDISILKAIGATNGQILSLFLKQGVYIGVTGGLIGMALALAISAVLERYQFIDLPDLYMLARLPLTYDYWVYGTVAGISLVIATVAGAFPAWLASRVNPVEGFRGNLGAG